MTDREKFEAWYSDFSGQTLEWVASQRDGDRYRVGKYVQGYWLCYQAALASQQQADDGWIEWGGDISVNEQPVSGMVEITYRNGVISKANAAVRFWGHEGIESDIIAYRLVKP